MSIQPDLRAEFFKAAEFLLAAKALDGFNQQLLIIQLDRAIQKVNFHGRRRRRIHGGLRPQIHDRCHRLRLALDLSPGGIDP